MAQIDSRIAMSYQPQTQLENPTNALAKVMQIQGLQQESVMRGMQMQDAMDKRTSKNKLAALLQGQYETPEARESALLSGGFLDEAQTLGKSRRENVKSDLDTDATRQKLATERYTTFKKTLGALSQRPDLNKEMAIQAGQELVTAGIIPAAMYEQSIAGMPDDPNALRARLRDGVTAQMTPEQMFTVFAPKAEKIDNGQSIGFRDTNPNSPTYGQNTGGAAVQKMQSPDSIASNETSRRGQDITRRGQDLVNARGAEANSLKAREVAMMGDGPSGGPVLGAPVPAVLPWANQSNPKDANKVKASEQARGAKEIEKDIDAARKEREAAAQAKRFLELNKGTNTGGLTDRMGITRGIQSLGGNYAEMESITAKLAPAMRVEGSGSTSDFDGKQFERATVGVDKPGTTNTNIAKGIIARAQQADEYADFRQTYLEQNGTLQGADRFWKEYANKNPIFDPAKEGTFELNAKRKPWAEHFKQGKPAKPSAGAGEGLSAAEAAELADLRKRLGK